MKKRNYLGVMAVLTLALVLAACATTDAGLTGKVKAKLAAANDVPASRIEVSTRDGVVTLTGNVDDPAVKDRAIALARDTKGVVDVVDMIAVQTTEATGDAPEPDRTVGDRIDDAGITMKVKANLLDDPVVKGLRIDVDTREGIVYLTGNVSSENEKDAAIRIAKGTEGVRDVQANLTMKSS
jgi:osmotically-inducible protein OsmY